MKKLIFEKLKSKTVLFHSLNYIIKLYCLNKDEIFALKGLSKNNDLIIER